jgi:two-component system, NarL family, sensor histidine kinase UhpB
VWMRQLPLEHSSVEFLGCALLGFVTWAAVQFLLRYSGTRLRWVDRALPLQCALLTVSLLVAGPAHLNLMASIWWGVLALQVAAAAVWYLRRPWHGRAAWVMAGLMAALLVASGLEALVQWGGPARAALGSAAAVLLGGAAPRAALVAELVVPVIFVLVGLRLVQQHGRALQHAELDKAVLEQRVREATAQVEANYRQMAELRVEQVTERERKRIAADLHDDLGAKLLTIVHTSDNERISTLAREALEEMRLSVRGLTGRPVRLADALGDWRAEVVSRLAQAGIEAEWVAPEDLPQTLSARAYVQTTRILREATSNIIKHSGARNCSVSAGIADGDFQLVVQDDGDGIATDISYRMDRGHGLASMKNRAKQLQGQCLVESGPGFGTVIRLTLPLNRAVEGS